MAARFVAIESLLLVCLLALTGYVFWETLGVELGLDRVWASLKAAQEPDSWQSTLLTLAAIGVCCLPIIGYWVLQWVGMTRVSFWLVTLAALLPQVPALLAYNRLDWPSFWVGPLFSTELSQVMVGLLFLLSLVLLVTLHRTGDLRRLQGRLNARRLGSLAGTKPGGHRGGGGAGRAGWSQPGGNGVAAVRRGGRGPDERPAGPLPLDRTDHRRGGPAVDGRLSVPVAAHPGKGVTADFALRPNDGGAALSPLRGKEPSLLLNTPWIPACALTTVGARHPAYRDDGGVGPRWDPESTIMVSPVTCSAPSRSQTTGSATASVVPAVFNGAELA